MNIQPPSARAGVRRNYLLALLMVIMVFNYVDRLALGLLLEDIKRDLALTDTQLGFLTGITFAFFYAVMGIPIARWADRGNRITIVTLTTSLWSIAVALCGAAASFIQLMWIRVGVAVGEAGCYPPALSLISDYFSRAERPRAVSRYMLGWPIALIIGNLSAGWLNEWYGWRMTFVVLGLPGILLAVLAWGTLKDPRCAKSKASSDTQPARSPMSQPSSRQVLLELWNNSAYRHVVICSSLVAFFAYGIFLWQPTFFVRSHQFSTGELGTWLAVVYGVGGLFGTWLGGELASRYAPNDERLQLRALAVLYVIFAVLSTGVYLAPNRALAFGLLTISAVGGAATNGPLLAATQTVVPAHMRAVAVAVYLFFSSLIGMGLGPLAVGALSDALRPALSAESLRYALLAFCPGYFWCAWHAWRAGQTARAAADTCALDDRTFPVTSAQTS